MYGKT